jgi:origin recognition complex subunit 5
VESLLADLSTDRTKTALFQAFLDFILKLVRQQCNEPPLIVDLVKRLYPSFEGGATTGKATGKELNRLYKQCEGQARTLIRAENIQETTAALVESFSLPERFLLIAIYLASHNNAKHDIELFCNTGAQGKRKRRVFKAKGKKKKGLEEAKTATIKPVPIERLLAIFYFIYPVDLKAPERPTVLLALNRLIACKLVVRCTPAQRMLQGCKVKCNFGQSLMGHLSRHVGFQYERYLARPI